jgi:hypothetical protein
MPQYVYVEIIWRITSYSTLFILKRNTGNYFYLLSYVRLSGTFLEKVRQKTLFRTTRFRLFTRSLAIFFGCRYTKGYPLTTPPAHWKWRGTAYRWEARLIEFTVNRSSDNRGSTLFKSATNEKHGQFIKQIRNILDKMYTRNCHTTFCL